MEYNGAHSGQEAGPEENQIDEDQSSERVVQDNASMNDLLEEQGISLDLPSQGEVRQGIIATIRENEILVSIGTKSEGIISGRELEQIPTEERSSFEIGQEVPVFVIAPEDPNGNVVLSYTRAREEKDWDVVENLLESGEAYKSEVIGYNKGGLIVSVGRLRGFVPASQIGLMRRMATSGDSPEQRYGDMVDEPIMVRVIEVDRSRRRLILSERLALQETRESLKDRLLENLDVGDVRTGRVTSLADFGAFVNIEGADGLVHLSEISWDRIQHPNEVLEVGQEVDVKVISVDNERKRIGLSIRQLQEDPWMQKIGSLREGLLIEGTITHLTKFGAFARIGEELEGLIHVSELSELRIAHPKEVVHVGDVVTLRIIKIDAERRRIGLSLRKVDSAAYADLDWKMALAEEVDRTQTDEDILGEEYMEAAPAKGTQEVEDPERVMPDEIASGEDESDVDDSIKEQAESLTEPITQERSEVEAVEDES